MDARGAEDVKQAAGGALRVQGYEPRKLRTWIKLTGGAPALSGKDPIAHILWLQREHPDIARATWKYLEPKDWLNLKLTGKCAATYDSIVLHWITDNRDLANIDYDAGLLRAFGVDRAQFPDLIPATAVLGPLQQSIARELGVPAGIPVVGGTPDLQSAAIGSGAVRDFEGHVYVGTSSWLTCHVPFKKTDLFHGIASLPSPLPGKYLVADEQEVAGASLNWLRDNVIYPDDALRDTVAPDDFYLRLDDVAASAAPGSNGVIFTPWLNGERTPVDDHRLRGGWHDLSLQSTRADLVRSVLEGVAFNNRWLLGYVEKFTGKPFNGLNFIGGRAPDPRQRTWRGCDRGARARPHDDRGDRDERRHRGDVPARPRQHGRIRRALSGVPRDPQTDEGHLREVAQPCLTTEAAKTCRCGAGACRFRASSIVS